MAYGDLADPDYPLDVLPARRGHPVLAWLVIVAIIVGIPAFRAFYSRQDAAEVKDRLGQMVVTLQAKYFVGVAEIVGRGEQQQTFIAQAEALNTGPIEQRLRSIILLGEFSSPRAAEQQLRSLEDRVVAAGRKFTPEQEKLKNILVKLYSDYSLDMWQAPTVGPADRELVRAELGWSGELALAPALPGGGPSPERTAVLMSARKTFILFVVVILAAGLFGIVGFVGLVIYVIMLLNGRLAQRLQTGSSNGGIYAETFAVWMVLFVLLNVAAAFIPGKENSLMLAGGASLFSVGALLWPVLRGIPWRQVRQEIGLIGGPQRLLEPFIGLYGYVMGLPLLVIGMLIMLVLMVMVGSVQTFLSSTGKPGDEFGPAGYPAHPIVEYLGGADWWLKVQVLIIGSLIAPLVEEIMFRGVLHRHLREATARMGFFLSFVLSGTVVSFVFAVIHPQGLLAVPALMALAYAFTLLREWRGSLVSCMIAHGLNNFLVMCMAMALFGS